MAFDPGFTGYRRDPNTGGIFFGHPSGREMLFAGPEAEQMAADIDRMRPPDVRIASYDPSAPFGSASSVPDVPPGGMSAPPPPEPAMSVAPPGPPPPTTPPVDGTPGASVEQQQRPLPGGEAPPQYVSSTGYPTGPSGDPLFPQPTEISAYKRVAPRAGGYMPTAQTKSVEGAQNFSEDLKEGYRDLAIEKRATALAQMDAEQAVFAGQQAAAEAALPELQRQAEEARQQQYYIGQQVQGAKNEYQRLADEAANSKIEDRGVWGAGAMQGVGTLISAALTSFGSAILGRGPTGFDVINSAINRDIAQQRAEIDRKGARANNALSRYRAVFGDQQMAEAALKAIQIRQADTMAARQTAMIGTAQAQQQYQQVSMAAQKELLDAEKAFEAAAQGKATVTVNQRYQAPSAGGIVRKTPEELKREVEAARAVGEYNRDAQTGFKPQLEGVAAIRKNQDERELIVNLPDGRVAYAADNSRAKQAEARIAVGDQLRSNFAKMRSIIEKYGENISPETRGQLEALVAANKTLAKDAFELGALTKADTDLISPLVGENALERMSFDSKTLSQLNVAEQLINGRISQSANQLFVAPPIAGQQNKRFDYAARDTAGVKADGAIARPSVGDR